MNPIALKLGGIAGAALGILATWKAIGQTDLASALFVGLVAGLLFGIVVARVANDVMTGEKQR